MKILILAENLEINRTSSGITSNNQIFLYKRFFTNIEVITTTPHHLLKEIEGVKYHYLKKLPNVKKEWISRLPKSIAIQNFIFGLDYYKYCLIKHWVKAITKLLKKNNYNIIVSLSSGGGFIPAYATYYLKFNFSFKSLLFIHDPFPLNQYPPPYQIQNSYPYRSISRLFGKVLKSADILSFPSVRLMEWMSKYYPEIENKHIIQPHIGIPQDELRQILPKDEVEKTPVLSKGINIVHTGSLLGPRNPNFLIKALELLFKRLSETNKIFNLHIIGKINKNWNTEKLGSENVHVYKSRVSYLRSIEIQHKAQVLLLLEAVSDVSPFMPGKLADYIMAGKPILALTPKKSETTRILGQDYPLLAENGNVEEIYNKLVIIYNHYLEGNLLELVPNQKLVEYVGPRTWIKPLREKLNTK